MSVTVITISGSLRKDSFTTKLLRAFAELAPAEVTVKPVEIGNLPLINEDLESNLPESVKKFHEQINAADAVLLGTPEYNRSFSPAIKNALDWGSRPDDDSSWEGKPVAIVGATLYSLGAFGAVNHLRQVVNYLNMPAMAQPEFYLPEAAQKFDEKGKLVHDGTKEKITAFWTQFVIWIDRNRS